MGSLILTTLFNMLKRVLTARLIEHAVILGIEEVVKSSKHKATHRLLEVAKEELGHK